MGKSPVPPPPFAAAWSKAAGTAVSKTANMAMQLKSASPAPKFRPLAPIAPPSVHWPRGGEMVQSKPAPAQSGPAPRNGQASPEVRFPAGGARIQPRPESFGRPIRPPVLTGVRAMVLQRAAHSKPVKPNLPALMAEPSFPSDSHVEESLGRNYKSLANQPLGFSVAPRATMLTDLALVKKFVLAMHGSGDWDDVEDVSYDTDGEKVVYTLPSGRIYTTHDTTSQLYPLSGASVRNGRGALDMARVLRLKGGATEAQKIVLAQLHQAQLAANWEGKTKAAGQMGTKDKQALVKYFNEQMI
jgi:hypothetical protein